MNWSEMLKQHIIKSGIQVLILFIGKLYHLYVQGYGQDIGL